MPPCCTSSDSPDASPLQVIADGAKLRETHLALVKASNEYDRVGSLEGGAAREAGLKAWRDAHGPYEALCADKERLGAEIEALYTSVQGDPFTIMVQQRHAAVLDALQEQYARLITENGEATQQARELDRICLQGHMTMYGYNA